MYCREEYLFLHMSVADKNNEGVDNNVMCNPSRESY
ncbi:hypothetical protein Pecwa_2134 [Pectobacterium parmentieri WPP163]|nr:hypothetical protein Pecwa_2134 [Pectobacterium parmentieri WPP163]POW27597.1 hypothetical protein PB20LOC_02244 [Pectobacterium parmentieri]